MNPQILEKDIIELLGLDNLPEDKKAALLAKMAETVLNRISLRILDQLSDADQKRFNALLKQKTADAEIDQFLKSKIKNLDEMRMAEILRFKQELSADAEYIQQKLTS